MATVSELTSTQLSALAGGRVGAGGRVVGLTGEPRDGCRGPHMPDEFYDTLSRHGLGRIRALCQTILPRPCRWSAP
jgi:hypothetical protein